MNETITVGQKIGFAVVVMFVLALCGTPFVAQDKDSKGAFASIDNGVKNARRIVAVR